MKTRYTRKAARLVQDAIILRTRYVDSFSVTPNVNRDMELKQPTTCTGQCSEK